MEFTVIHPQARAEAGRLLDRHGARAVTLIEAEFAERLAAGDMERVLHLDQVRRAVERLRQERHGTAHPRTGLQGRRSSHRTSLAGVGPAS